ncbi:MAG: hypothetical protein HYX23_02110 [Candidatus Zambryskibacteria bacterium]|nr:hypothetical protein [Candidatus Zambryskibacteria bacterium]
MLISGKQKTFPDLFPAPEFLMLSSTGVVIKDTNTRFVQLKRRIFGDGFELAYASRIDNPSEAIESGLINNPNELAAILKKFALSHHVQYVKASLPEEKAYLFTANINWVPFEGLRDAVAFIIEENVPISLAEAVFDFEIVSEDRPADKIKLAVSVLPKNIVRAYEELFESAGMIPISFDLESRAAARALIPKGDRQTTLVINFSTKKTGFYVVEEEVVQFSTTLAYSIDTADHHSDSKEFLKEEMRKVITFWNARAGRSDLNPHEGNGLVYHAGKIEKIILCGSKGHRANLIKKFMDDSEIPYAPANVWLKTSHAGDRIPEIPFDESLGFASTIGLVLPHNE